MSVVKRKEKKGHFFFFKNVIRIYPYGCYSPIDGINYVTFLLRLLHYFVQCCDVCIRIFCLNPLRYQIEGSLQVLSRTVASAEAAAAAARVSSEARAVGVCAYKWICAWRPRKQTVVEEEEDSWQTDNLSRAHGCTVGTCMYCVCTWQQQKHVAHA